MAKPRLYATTPDGRVASRQTDQPYTHAVAVQSVLHGWSILSFHRSEALATQQATSSRIIDPRWDRVRAVVVPVTDRDPAVTPDP